MARPIPRPDPVTRADLPLSGKDMISTSARDCPASAAAQRDFLLHCIRTYLVREEQLHDQDDRPSHMAAAVHVQLLPSDVIRVGCQEARCLRNFFRSGEAAQWNLQLYL